MVNMHHRKTLVKAGSKGFGNCYGKKRILCIWWDQEGVVYHGVLKSSETINRAHYQQQIVNSNHTLIVKQPQWASQHKKAILLHHIVSPQTSKPVKNTLNVVACEVLLHPLYLPDLTPSDFHLLRSMAHTPSRQHFQTYDDVAKWLTD